MLSRKLCQPRRAPWALINSQHEIETNVSGTDLVLLTRMQNLLGVHEAIVDVD